MTNLSKDFREKLNDSCTIAALTPVEILTSKLDGTQKYLFRLADGNVIESVLMKYHHGNTVCISTQVGCRMGCKFCASTLAGLVRSLEPSEMLDEIYTVTEESGQRVSNVVLMGIGEPFDNYDNVMKFLDILSSPEGYNLSLRHLSLSTCGLVDRIYELAEKKTGLTLSISLHAPNDELRNELVPINQKFPLKDLLAAVRNYVDNSNANCGRVTIEYVLLDHVNDSMDQAHELAQLLKDLPCKINLIPFNPHEESEFKRPSNSRIDRFYKVLVEQYGFTVVTRTTRGDDIAAACGQLAGQVKDRRLKEQMAAAERLHEQSIAAHIDTKSLV